MAGPAITEAGYTEFGLSVPMVLANATPATVDRDGDGSEGGSSVIPGVLFGILVPHIVCTAFIVTRSWSRLFLLRKWFLDDTLIVLAWAFSTAVCVVYSIAAQSPRIRSATILSSSPDAALDSYGADDYDYDPAVYYSQADTLRPYILRTYIGLILYQLCLCLTKLSILAFYLRIFASRPLLRRLAWATVIGVVLFGCPLLFMSIFQCHPSAGLFFGLPMKCFTFDPLLIASTSLHAATDAWLILLIIPCIMRLADLPPRQKTALAVVLSLSIFVIAASLIRLQLSLRANHRPSGDGVGVVNTLAFFVMTILELDMALICASAPTLRLVVARLWPRLGMGEQPAGRRRRARRGSAGNDGDDHDDDDDDDDDASVDLTSVVSYHGYPWTQPATPASQGARSKNPSVADVGTYAAATVAAASAVPPVPGPPAPAMLAHRTPTTLSLRSFMSSMAPRSRGQTLAGGGEDRTGLLGDGDVGAEQRRRSSVGFEGYYEQYLGYDEREKRRSRCDARSEARRSRGSQCYSGRWGDSQESFVLGMNDPNSPSRLSPVSRMGEGANAASWRPASNHEKSVSG
ncbi:Rhodopsin domain-containing protein [Madurella fahalii]|uniref:Rhodopsin domain-containing protein n=1 Tax=Madurella fahalii TaxID=1157608 RepID=A0ABQ0GEU9_9PEZI